jgi:hypothetical protein
MGKPLLPLDIIKAILSGIGMKITQEQEDILFIEKISFSCRRENQVKMFCFTSMHFESVIDDFTVHFLITLCYC